MLAFMSSPQFIPGKAPYFNEAQMEMQDEDSSISIQSLTSHQRRALELSSRLKGTKIKDEKQTVLPAGIIWDRNLETFVKFRNRLQGHYSQTGPGYMFDTESNKHT